VEVAACEHGMKGQRKECECKNFAEHGKANIKYECGGNW
jgi:hypothetical protein